MRTGGSDDMKRHLFIALLILTFATMTRAQMLAVKSNALMDVAMIPNVGLELTVSNRLSVAAQVYGTLNIYGMNTKAVALEPELRYWPISGVMNKLYVGAAALFARYDTRFTTEAFKGDGLGAGLSFGWVWPLTKYHWNIEAGATLGVIRYSHKHSFIKDYIVDENYDQNGLVFMPFQIGVTFSYILHYKNEVDPKRRK